MEFLVTHKSINTYQHGFLKARPCLTNLLCFWEEITKWVDDGSPVDLVHLDFQKAFNNVSHQILLLKQKTITGNNVINDRKVAYIHKTASKNRWYDFKQEICFVWGTTRISIRKYTIFNIYKSFGRYISSKVLKFADDTKVLRNVKCVTDKQRLQIALDKWPK